MSSSWRRQEVEALFSQLCKCRLLVRQEGGQRHSFVSAASKDGLVKGLLQALVLEVLMGVVNDLDDRLVPGIRANLFHRQVGNQGAQS